MGASGNRGDERTTKENSNHIVKNQNKYFVLEMVGMKVAVLMTNFMRLQSNSKISTRRHCHWSWVAKGNLISGWLCRGSGGEEGKKAQHVVSGGVLHAWSAYEVRARQIWNARPVPSETCLGVFYPPGSKGCRHTRLAAFVFVCPVRCPALFNTSDYITQPGRQEN